MHSLDFVVKDDDTEFEQKYPNGLTLSDLVPFYHAVARNDPIKLEWVCHGKLSSVKEAACTTSASSGFTTATNVSQSKQTSPGAVSKLAEFDFDDANQLEVPAVGMQSPASGKANFRGGTVGASMAGPLPLRRVGGTSRSAPKQHRVANMDKILNDFFRTRKETNTVPHPAQQPEIVAPLTPSITAVDDSIYNTTALDDRVTVVHTAPLNTQQPSQPFEEPTDSSQPDASDTVAATEHSALTEVTSLPIDHLTVTDKIPSEDVTLQPETTENILDASNISMDMGDLDVPVEAANLLTGVMSPPSIDGSHVKAHLHLPVPRIIEANTSGATGLSDPMDCQIIADHVVDSAVVDSEVICESSISTANNSPPVNQELTSN